jgi:hypothetical protein
MIPEPNFTIHQSVSMVVTGGNFAVTGRRWSEAMGQYVYEVREVSDLRLGRPMNFTEDMLKPRV